MTYAEKLKDPRWNIKRLEVLLKDKYTCRVCYKKNKELHVHHLIYIEDAEPWDYCNDLLLTVCDKCHKNIHENFDIPTVNDNHAFCEPIIMSDGTIRQEADAEIIGRWK